MDPTSIEWDERYKEGGSALPWDTGSPAPELTAYFSRVKEAPKNVLELGCGTGTNAIWLVQQGCNVVATDISPTAIEWAQNKAKSAGVSVDFRVSDICVENPVESNSVEFIFDRGVFHVMAPDKREHFVQVVHNSLCDGGIWLCLAGSADQKRESDDQGPPQLSATELISSVEKLFEVHKLAKTSFLTPEGHNYVAWKAIFKKR
jgi:cyclopropane fatty-acyl-phospholipid synthase-like methyltransferase